jgi:DNA polymerase III subunit gamma/tau
MRLPEPSHEIAPQNVEILAQIPVEKLTENAPTFEAETSERSETQATTFNGDWRKLIEQNLKLGLARALAQNCEMVAYDADSFTLRVAESNKHLAAASYQAKLVEALNAYFDRKIKLTVEVSGEAQASINTPAKQVAVEKATIQSSAENAILNDSFVQALMSDFGATIIPNSIKPV